jgi:hypothetical protein
MSHSRRVATAATPSGELDSIYEEMASLKQMEDERLENRRSERDAMNNLVFKLRKSVTTLSKVAGG